MKSLCVRFGALALGLMAALPALAADKDPVAAVVNGHDIHVSAVADLQRSLPPQMAQAPYEALLDTLINSYLVSDAARKDGIDKDPEVKAALKQAEDTVLRKGWMAKKLRAEVTDAAVHKQYDQFVANFKPEDEIHARHVLLDNEDAARAVISELKRGAKFEDVAKSKSKDPSAQQNGGDLGFFTKNEMVPQFADAAFAMKAGDISSVPVKTQYGWHVIKVEERRLTSAPPFDEARPVIREQMAEAYAQKLVGDMRTKAKVKRFDPEGKPLPDAPAPAAAPAAPAAKSGK